MPELPEVETVRRGLNLVTLNRKIQGGDVLLTRTIAHPASAQEFLDGLKGCAIAQWHRRGKYLLAELKAGEGDGEGEGGQGGQGGLGGDGDGEIFQSKIQNLKSKIPAGFLGVHLRMTGQLLWVNPAEPLQKHTRIRLFFAGNQELRFVDQRTFGQLWWVPPGAAPESIMTGLQHLGPEPFSEAFSATYLHQTLQHRRRPVKTALLDQAIVAGIGNIYADEALFLSSIRPQQLCTQLSCNQIQRLHANILQVLQASIDANGTTFRTFRTVEGVNGNYGGVAWVYARDGEACRTCGTVIERLKLAGRSAHFCPQCQP